MQVRCRKLHLLFLIVFCFGQGFANQHLIHPPILSIEEDFVDLRINETFQVRCTGALPVTWKIPEKMSGLHLNSSRLSISSSVNTSVPVDKYQSVIILKELEFNDTGMYTCMYKGAEDSGLQESSTGLYLFVNDPVHLFVRTPGMMVGVLFIQVRPNRPTVIACLPTGSRVNVTLWKIHGGYDHDEMVIPGDNVVFDPTKGFIIKYPTPSFIELFQCRATNGDVEQSVMLNLNYMPDTLNAPRPYINDSQAQHPVVNATFILTCAVEVEPGTTLFMEWNYPNKKEIGDRITATAPSKYDKTIRGFRYEEVVTQLIVKNARLDDSGYYGCNATDHSTKTGRIFHHIQVHEHRQPSHVNFTTDVDTSQPMVASAGEDVRFVVSVRPYPFDEPVVLFWEKNGRPLQTNSHYRVERNNSTIVLQILQVVRADAARYVLHGRTSESNSSLSIDLDVRDKPVVSISNAETVYILGNEHHLACNAEGFPTSIVRWRWKPCLQPGPLCDPGESKGWKDVEQNGGLPNKENVTIELSDSNGVQQSVSMHLMATESGYYKCIASNDMGQDNITIPFIVTDAVHGFEFNASNKRPVERDTVQLLCKVNTHDYTHIEWKWRPMNTAAELRTLQNDTGVFIFNVTTPYSHTSIVTLSSILRNQSGEYECIAGNSNNITAEKQITLDVRAIKKPHLLYTNLVGVANQTLPGSFQEFFCYSNGVPIPEITWRKDGAALDVANVSGVEITQRGQRLTIRRVMERDKGLYECIAENRGGTVRANVTLEVLPDNRGGIHKGLTNEIIATIVGIICIILIPTIVISSCLMKRINKEKKQKKQLDFISYDFFERGYTDLFNPSLPIEDQIDLLPYKHDCEFPKERLKLGKTLGQGAFGRVVKAEAIGLVEGETSTTVAVKMLKEAADLEQRKALVAELKILIHIGRHLNIVNLMGAVTKNMSKGELYVIVEYCCYGNLRHYLLKHKSSFVDQVDRKTGQLDPQRCSLPGSPPPDIKDNMVTYSNILALGMDNPSYRENSLNYADLVHNQVTNDSGTGISVFTNPSGSSVGEQRYLRSSVTTATAPEDDGNESFREFVITTCDLLCLAFQCARGMEYLASRKLIHRDLAARNVLLAKDRVVKICDFGLAKDCYKYSNYIKKTDGLLPVKWMAIESIRDRVFTTKTDVWSFGILLWELFTLGGNPYPGVEINEEFFKKLKNGYRMEKPEFSPERIYRLMKSCWLDDPNHRPDFGYLAETIGALLENSVRKYYVELNAPYQMMNVELFSNNNDYLQMTGVSKEEYTNMMNLVEPVSEEVSRKEAVPMILLNGGIPSPRQESGRLSFAFSGDEDARNITYLNMTSSSEKEDCDSVFLEKSRDKVHYENGFFHKQEQEMNTRC